jgi:hypothetical protein
MDNDYKLCVYVNEGLRNWIQAAASAMNCSVSEFLRRLMLREKYMWEIPTGPGQTSDQDPSGSDSG